MKPERVMVILPTLGVSPLLSEAVTSVRGASRVSLRVCVTPQERVNELQAKLDGWFVLPDGGKSEGLYGAINRALKATAGDWDWFTYINDDDRLESGFDRMAAEHLKGQDPAGIAYGDVIYLNEGGERIARMPVCKRPRDMALLWRRGLTPLTQQGTLVSKAALDELGGFNEAYRLCADSEFWMRALRAGIRYQYHPFTVGAFRIRQGQLSSDVARVQSELQQSVASVLGSGDRGSAMARAEWRFRMANLGRYFERVWTNGWKTSAEMFSGGGSREQRG